MSRKVLRYSDVAPAATTSGYSNRPPCYGKRYNDDNRECTNQCPFTVACRPLTNAYRRRMGQSAPAAASSGGTMSPLDEPIPEIVEASSPDDSFWTKLGYNMGLQVITAGIREMLHAACEVPRKRYFDREK